MSAANPPPSGSGSGASGSGGSAGSTGPTSTALNIPQTAADGILTVTQPPQTATSFYKLAPNNIITFGWSLSAVIATPTSITIHAVGSNGNTYPVGPTSVPGTQTTIEWDIYSYQQANPTLPLVQGPYHLTFWDDRGPDATNKAGFMSPNNQLNFAIYTTQPYTPLSSGWQCTGCGNDALASVRSSPLLVAILSTFVVMVLGGFHVLRRALH